MEAAELIRKLIDVLSQINEPEQQPNHAHLTVVTPAPHSDFPERDHTNDETGGIMVPPLQQKIELLKKVANVDSIYGDDEEEQAEDELSIIRRNAGINPIVSMMTSDDTDIES
jgi:hypothetical protein